MARQSHTHSPDRQTLRWAELAARLMREKGLPLAAARQKAALQLRSDTHRINHPGPSDQLIMAALHSQMALFSPSWHARLLLEKRSAALAAMQFFQAFAPRLSGAVLDGSAQPPDPVVLHLHPETPEEVPMFLDDHHLSARHRSARLLFADGIRTIPRWDITRDDIDHQLWILPASALRTPPLQSPHGPAAIPRADIAHVRTLLAL